MLTEKQKQQLIIENYEYGNLDELAKTINKKKHAIQEWARKRGLKRKISVKRMGNLSKLLNGSLESFYWLGFHAADGYISKNGHFMLSQARREHLELLAKFLETEVKIINQSGSFSKAKISYRVAIYDRKTGQYINNMFGIVTQKTYDVIKLDFLHTLEQVKSFFIGYTDGDGYINSHSIRLQCHKNWYSVYQTLIDKLSDINGHYRLILEYKKSHNDSYATMCIRSKYSRELHTFAVENNLPINTFKWDKLSKNPKL